MSLFEIVVLCLLVAAVVAVLALRRAGRVVLASRMRERVVVTTKQGATFAGVLWQVDTRALVLREAQVVTGSGEHSLVDGELLVLVSDVAYLQKP